MSENLRKPKISTFVENEFYEDLISLRAASPKTFASLSLTTHHALAAYEKAKAKARAAANGGAA